MPLLSRLKDLASVITALTAVLTAAGALLDKLPTSFVGLEGNDVLLVSTIIVGLTVLTVYLQWDRFYRSVVLRLDAFAQRFHGAIALLNATTLLLTFAVLTVVVLSLRDQQEITASTATRYVASFPGNTSYITEIIDQAKSPRDELVIIVDYPSYGSYSALDAYKEIEASLVRAAVSFDVNVRMCYYDQALAKKDMAGQRINDELQKWNTFAAWKEFFHKDRDIQTDDEFHKALLDVDDMLVAKLRPGKNFSAVRNLSDVPPVFLWLLNTERAVFSFPGENETFVTRDLRLLSAFQRLAQKYCPATPR